MKELDEFEKEMQSIGLEIVKKQDIKENKFIGVEVDLDTEIDYSHLVEEDFILKKLTGRKDFFYISLEKYDKEINRLTLKVYTPVSEDIFEYYADAATVPGLTNDNVCIGTNFPDLCWYHAEGTTPLTADEVETKFRSGVNMGDLTWYLPSRVVDNLIEIMHTMNQSFLQGLMQDTICYGPYVFER